jgi:hypothetical protein
MKDLDGEVLADLAENVLLFLLDYLAGPMMRVDHVVADLEVDVDNLALDLEVVDINGCIGNGSSFDKVVRMPDRPAGVRFASSGPRG